MWRWTAPDPPTPHPDIVVRATVRILYLRTCVYVYAWVRTHALQKTLLEVCVKCPRGTLWRRASSSLTLPLLGVGHPWHIWTVKRTPAAVRRKCACASVQYTDCVCLLSVPKCPITQRTPGCIKMLLFFDVQTASEGFCHTFTVTTKWRRALRLFIRFSCYAHKCTNCSYRAMFKFNNCDKPVDHVICWHPHRYC